MCWFLRQWPGLGLGQKCAVIPRTRAVKTSAVRMSDVRILKLGNGAVMLQTPPPAQTFSTPRPGDLFVMTILIYSHKSIDDTFSPRMGNLFPHSWTLLDGKDSPHHYWPLHRVLVCLYCTLCIVHLISHRLHQQYNITITITWCQDAPALPPRAGGLITMESCWCPVVAQQSQHHHQQQQHHCPGSTSNMARAVSRAATGVLLDHCICRWWSHITQPKDNGS